MGHRGAVEVVRFSRCCRSGRRGVRNGGRERRVDEPEEVVMDAHGKEDRAPDKEDRQPPILCALFKSWGRLPAHL